MNLKRPSGKKGMKLNKTGVELHDREILKAWQKIILVKYTKRNCRRVRL